MVSEARPFPLALSKDVMVECHWCESTDATLSSFGMFAATSPGRHCQNERMQLGISGLIGRPDWWAGEAGAFVVCVSCGGGPYSN